MPSLAWDPMQFPGLDSVDYSDIGRFVTSGGSEGMVEMLSDSSQQLKNAGAHSLVLCANVAHKAAATLEKRTGLPVLHIVDFTGQAIVDRGFRKVGLIATRAVMEEDFYKTRLRERYGLEVVVPSREFRDEVDGFQRIEQTVRCGGCKGQFRGCTYKYFVLTK